MIRKSIKSDKLTIISFIVKICLEGRKLHFPFFISQIKKLIKEIFFQNMIDIKDISIQVDIPNYTFNNIESNNIKVDKIILKVI